VLAIFAARLLNGKPPLIHEDGGQRRDFVSVHDVARACRLALEAPLPTGSVVCNVGSGASHTVRGVAEALSRALGRWIPPRFTGQYRVGDIRHCFADIAYARQALGYAPRVRFEEGLEELVAWLSSREVGDGPAALPAADGVEDAQAELLARGLVRGSAAQRPSTVAMPEPVMGS